MYLPKVTQVSEDAFAIDWPEEISADINKQVCLVEEYLREIFDDKIIDIIISYCSLLIIVECKTFPVYQGVMVLNDLLETLTKEYLTPEDINQFDLNHPSKHHLIDVYYSTESGWDLQSISEQTKQSIEKVISLHTGQRYRVFANGFIPGFCYLGKVDKKIQLPRKATPRLNVPKGAVAMAEQQTAIYPTNSPGGWHILGQSVSPLLNDDPYNPTPLLGIGDTVSFNPISKEAFIKQGGKIALEGNDNGK